MNLKEIENLIEEDTEKTYQIIRCYYTKNPNIFKTCDTIRSGVTLEQAKEHCNDPSTSVEGEYFDAFIEE